MSIYTMKDVMLKVNIYKFNIVYSFDLYRTKKVK